MLRDLGCVVIDADEIARQVVLPGSEGLAEVVAIFGPTVLNERGELDRRLLGDIVFDSPELRARLEAVLHPRIAAEARAVMDAQAPDSVVVYEVPLLIETGGQRNWDAVIVVDCPDDLRLRRLVEERGMDPQAARARMAAQASRSDRLAAADVVIENSGTYEQLRTRVTQVMSELSGAPRGE